MTEKLFKYARPLLDGVKVQISGGFVPQHIKNNMVREILGGQPNFTGEIVVGSPTAEDVHERTLAFVNDATAINLFVFWIYDIKTTGLYALKDRLNMAEQMMCCNGPNFQFVDHAIIESLDELRKYDAVVASRGFTGIVLREPYGTFGMEEETLKIGECAAAAS